MGGRASIVGAAVTHVGKVREHNEDAHYFDAENGLFLVCDGMGGHAAGEVASAIAIKTIRQSWNSGATHGAIDGFLAVGTPDAKKELLTVLRDGVTAAHDAIIAEARRDETKTGMGTTLVGAIVVGGDVIFAHAGDSRAYLVRDNIAMQLTEDHTLLSRLLAAGIDVDLTGDGARFKSMLTNALGIGAECKVSTFVVPLADGDRFLLCSDGISEYVKEAEVGEVLSKAASPSRAAQKLVDMALDRGGGDNATALVVRVLEAGESPLPVERRKRDDDVIAACSIWGLRVNPQQRLRALRIAIPRELSVGEKLPAQTLGDRVAWIVLEGALDIDGVVNGPASLVYPEALIASATLPDKDGLGIVTQDLRALAIRADDFREICEEDPDLGEALSEALVQVMAARQDRLRPRMTETRARAKTEPPVVDGKEADGETTAILAGPPKPERPAARAVSVSDSTQPLGVAAIVDAELDSGPPSLGRSATMPAIVLPPIDEPESPTTVAEDPEEAPAAKRKGDGGAALRALWSAGDGAAGDLTDGEQTKPEGRSAKLPLPAPDARDSSEQLPSPPVLPPGAAVAAKAADARAHAQTAPPPKSQLHDDAPTVADRPQPVVEANRSAGIDPRAEPPAKKPPPGPPPRATPPTGTAVARILPPKPPPLSAIPKITNRPGTPLPSIRARTEAGAAAPPPEPAKFPRAQSEPAIIVSSPSIELDPSDLEAGDDSTTVAAPPPPPASARTAPPARPGTAPGAADRPKRVSEAWFDPDDDRDAKK